MLALGIVLVGCNAFGTGETGNCDTTDECLADADVAIGQGDYDAAVKSLEKAYDKTPDNPEVRIKLATALYGQSNLSVVDLKNVSDYISDLEGDAVTSGLAKAHDDADLQCSVEAAEPDPENKGYASLDLETNESFSDILAAASVINRIENELLINGFRSSDAYTSLAPDLKASWLTNAAFADVASAILTVYSESQARGGHLFKDSGGGVVVCAPEAVDLDALECEAYRIAQDEDAEQGLLVDALTFIEEKIDLFGGSSTENKVPDALQKLIDAVKSNIDESDRDRCRADTNTLSVR